MFFHKKHSIKVKSADSGAALVEFALVAPLFFLLLFGIFEISVYALIKSSMELSLQQVSRFGRTGDLEGGKTQQQSAIALAQKYSFGLIDSKDLNLSTTVYQSFADLPKLSDAPESGNNYGSGSQIVLYTLTYNYHLNTPLVGKFFSTNNISKIKVSTVVVNEPF